MLEPKRKERGSQFFETYLACVLTLRNTLEWPALRVQLDLSLKGLVVSKSLMNRLEPRGGRVR